MTIPTISRLAIDVESLVLVVSTQFLLVSAVVLTIVVLLALGEIGRGDRQ